MTPDSLFVARNIVNQLADLWEVPAKRRQETNDQADRFVQRLIVKFMRDYLTADVRCAASLSGQCLQLTEQGSACQDECERSVR